MQLETSALKMDQERTNQNLLAAERKLKELLTRNHQLEGEKKLIDGLAEERREQLGHKEDICLGLLAVQEGLNSEVKELKN